MSAIINTVLSSYTTEELLTLIKNKLSEEEIMNYYLGNLTIRMKNPLRSDNHVGCNLFIGKSGNLLLHDFAKNKTYNCYGIVMEKFSLNYRDSLIKILSDFYGLGQITLPKSNTPIKLLKKALSQKTEFYIQIEIRPFSKQDKKFWKQFGINRTILKQYNVFSVSKVWKDKKLYMYSTEGNPIYAYVDIKEQKIKLYRPFESPEDKWRGNFTKDIIDGWNQLPETGDLCIITSSRKDVMTLKSLGYNAISAQGEKMLLLQEKLDELNTRFKTVLTLMDNDETGIEAYKNYKNLEINGFILPSVFECKDISDLYKALGRAKTAVILKSLIYNTIFQTNEFVSKV